MPRSLTLYPHAVSTTLELRVADPYDPTQQDLDLSWIMRGPGTATYRAAVIAEGRDVVMIVDHHDRPPEGTVQIKWENFSDSPNSWRRDHASDVFHLEPYGVKPTLFLNSRYQALRAVLHSR